MKGRGCGGHPISLLVQVPAWDSQSGAGSPPSGGASMGPQIPVWDPHPSLGLSILIQVPPWHPLPGITPQFQFGCWCGMPHPSAGPHPRTGPRIPVWDPHPSAVSIQDPCASTELSSQYRCRHGVPHSITGFPYWVPILVWVLEWDLPSWYRTPHPGTGSPSRYR